MKTNILRGHGNARFVESQMHHASCKLHDSEFSFDPHRHEAGQKRGGAPRGYEPTELICSRLKNDTLKTHLRCRNDETSQTLLRGHLPISGRSTSEGGAYNFELITADGQHPAFSQRDRRYAQIYDHAQTRLAVLIQLFSIQATINAPQVKVLEHIRALSIHRTRLLLQRTFRIISCNSKYFLSWARVFGNAVLVPKGS